MFTGKSYFINSHSQTKRPCLPIADFFKRLFSVIISNIMIRIIANGKLRNKNLVQLNAQQQFPPRPMRTQIIVKSQIQSGHVHQVWEPVPNVRVDFSPHSVHLKCLNPILGNEKQSLCIKFCVGSYATEHRKCLCKQSNCSWSTKGRSCPDVSADDGNLLFETSNLGSLRSIMREINIQNNGTINFTFQL